MSWLHDLIYKKPDKYTQIVNEKTKLSTAIEILNGDPGVSIWSSYTSGGKGNTRTYGFSIIAYHFDEAKWAWMHQYPEMFLGVKGREYSRFMVEKFNAKLVGFGTFEPVFENFEDAEKVVKDFLPYYENFYMPRAVMDRLLCYTDGGYPAYFKEKAKEFKEKIN